MAKVQRSNKEKKKSKQIKPKDTAVVSPFAKGQEGSGKKK